MRNLLLGLILLALASASHASTAFVQISKINETTSTTKTSPFAAPAVTGIAQNDIIVIWFGINSPIATTTVNVPTDTFGLTYSVIQAATNSDNNAHQIIGWCAPVGLHSGSDSITFTWTAATLIPRAFIIEYSGASCTKDAGTTSVGQSTSCAAGPITTTTSGDLLSSFAYGTSTGTSWTAGGSWLLESSSSALQTATADQQTVVIGSYTENISWTNTVHRICAIVALKKPLSAGSKLTGPSSAVGPGAIT